MAELEDLLLHEVGDRDEFEGLVFLRKFMRKYSRLGISSDLKPPQRKGFATSRTKELIK